MKIIDDERVCKIIRPGIYTCTACTSRLLIVADCLILIAFHFVVGLAPLFVSARG